MVHTVAEATTDEAYVEVTVTVGGSLPNNIVALCNPAGGTYGLRLAADTLTLRVGSGTPDTALASVPVTPTLPHRLRLERQGSTLRGYLDGVLMLTAADSTYTGCRRGAILGGRWTVRLDDFEMGDL